MFLNKKYFIAKINTYNEVTGALENLTSHSQLARLTREQRALQHYHAPVFPLHDVKAPFRLICKSHHITPLTFF
jgi:hypothetical protein